MTQELLYTSAPKGLKPGSRGFCTVVSTQGLPAPLVTALEGMSAIRPVYPHGDSRAADNPVNWSHMLLSAGGRPLHVLSRVADYGLDYSQRSNKLAHHVVLSDAECVAAGPAWVLQQPGVLQAAWDGAVRTLPQGRAIPRGRSGSLRAAAWERATGDAGWAGVVAEALQADPNRQVFFIFSPGMDLLPLVSEVLALLPEPLRWRITFSTYCTQLPPNATCQWRCHLADSPEAQQSQRFVKGLRIDLTKPLGAASGGGLVSAARTGEPTFSANVPVIPSSTDEVVDLEFATVPSAWNSPQPTPGPETAQTAYRLQPTAGPRPVRLSPPDLPPALPQRRRSWGTVALFSVIAVLFVAVLGGSGWLLYRNGLPKKAPSDAIVAMTPEPLETQPAERDEEAPPDIVNKTHDAPAPKEGATVADTVPPTQPPQSGTSQVKSSEASSLKNDPPATTLDSQPTKPQVPSVEITSTSTERSTKADLPASGTPTRPAASPNPTIYEFIPLPDTPSGKDSFLVIGNSKGSNLVMLTPVLESGTWRPNNTEHNVTVQVDPSTQKVLFEAEAHNSGKSYDIRLTIRPAPSKEKFWCGILAENEATIHLLRPRFGDERKFPVSVPFYRDWRSNEKGYGIPRIEYGAECCIQAAEHSIRLVYSQTKKTRTEVLATYSLAAPEETAKAIGLPPLAAIDPIEVWVKDGGDGLKIVVHPHSDEDLSALEAGLSREYAKRAREAVPKSHVSDFKAFNTIATHQPEVSRRLKELDSIVKDWGDKKSKASNAKQEADRVAAEDMERIARDLLSLTREYEAWLGNARKFMSALSAAELTKMHIFYQLRADQGVPITVDIVNIAANGEIRPANESSSAGSR